MVYKNLKSVLTLAKVKDSDGMTLDPKVQDGIYAKVPKLGSCKSKLEQVTCNVSLPKYSTQEGIARVMNSLLVPSIPFSPFGTDRLYNDSISYTK